MITGNRIAQADNIIWRRIGDDIVIIKDDGLATHVLNKTAAYIWELCDGKRGIDEIAVSLYERYDVSPEEARADTRETIVNLTKAGIIKYI
jgi:uncharacterized protein YaiI (UPF0178 family)